MKKFSEIVKIIEENKKELEFLPTGLKLIDDFLDGGFMRKELVILGGGTGKGKSFIAGNIFYNVAKKGFRSAYFSLEISTEMIASRLIGAISNIKPTRIIAGYLSQEEMQRKLKAKAEIGTYEELMYFYDDVYQLAMLEKEIKENKYDFIVIDFIQNVITNRPDEYERLSHIALSLQRIAKEANCCILLLSQLSNMVSRESRSDVIEYRGSGTIATVADLGFFIEKNEVIGDANTFRIRLRKNRRGISGMDWGFIFKHPGGAIYGEFETNQEKK